MKVMKWGGAFALALCLGFGTAQAQENRIDLSGALIGQIPVGDFDESVGRGFGGLGILEGGTFPGWAFSIRSGYIHYGAKSEVRKRTHIPFMLGVKYILPDNSLYLAGEAGYVLTEIERRPSPGERTTDNETNPGWGAAIGAMLGLLDLRLALNVWDANNMQESMAVGVIWGVRLQSY
jgi:hypothetical protein